MIPSPAAFVNDVGGITKRGASLQSPDAYVRLILNRTGGPAVTNRRHTVEHVPFALLDEIFIGAIFGPEGPLELPRQSIELMKTSGGCKSR